ncbi:cell division protein FtsA [Candidatus Palauibacter sp.]|uniref:cell division protein FtsA n=1 Tax=Candidatus Palauibacter sp. TaxID=3101350 RepID=UPI003AF2D2A0
MIQGAGSLVGVDVGSTKTCAVVVAVHPGRARTDPLEILGLGVSRSEGMNGSSVADVDAATRSVRAAVGQAEAMAGREVEAAYVSVPSGSVRTSRSKGVLSVSSSEVTQAHVKRVQEVGRAVPIPPGHELIHALSQQYSVDGRDGIRDPLGMSATRLEADICIVTADMAICRDLSRVIDRAGYRPDELVMAPLATALAVLDDSEREEGVALVEIGGATTDVLVYGGHRILHAATLPWGGGTVTRDIARGLGLHEDEAAQLKQRYGSARRDAVDSRELLDVSGARHGGARRVSRELLAHIIEQRLDEILGLVYDELNGSGTLNRLGAGIVLSGGGVSLAHTDDLARSVFNLPVRIGVPSLGITGMADSVALPSYGTAVGLTLYGATRAPAGGFVGATRAFARVGGWLREFF